MSSISDNFPSPAPHEDALAAARSAVIQVLTSTAEQRDQILHDAGSERERLLAGARAEATGVIDKAKADAAKMGEQATIDAHAVRQSAEIEAEAVRSEAESQAESILDQARGAAERVRGDAVAEAYRIRIGAEADAKEIREGALSVIDEIRSALAGLRSIDTRLLELSEDNDDVIRALAAQLAAPSYQAPEAPTVEDTPIALAPVEPEDADSDPDIESPTDQTDATDDASGAADPAPEYPATENPATEDPASENPASETRSDDAPTQRELSTEEFNEFMRQLAEHLDTLDRARSAGDRDEVGRVLSELGDLAERSNADDLATFARLLGPDARPEELDELIGHCYQVRFTQSVAS